MWRALFDEGVFTHTIAPPAVSATSCRLRVSMSAEHTDDQVDRVLDAFERAGRLRPSAGAHEMVSPHGDPSLRPI
jgi:8-amino-7-oxononanoate synthase